MISQYEVEVAIIAIPCSKRSLMLRCSSESAAFLTAWKSSSASSSFCGRCLALSGLEAIFVVVAENLWVLGTWSTFRALLVVVCGRRDVVLLGESTFDFNDWILEQTKIIVEKNIKFIVACWAACGASRCFT